ncbi:MAG TPA: type II secretion system protein GspC [Steroidobacteraceae bacterium]|nr:type II secretion system protein GspC [Steroidobacteraceae bacterium]
MNAASWLEGLPAQERWRALLLREGPRIATWVLALALGVQAALIITDLASGSPKAAAVATQATHARPLDLATITNAHLFGTAPIAKQDAANAPATSIPLVLTGIIAGNDPQNGLAILGPTPQATKVYAVGDTIAGGPKLHSVYSDRVVIDRDGQLESLALPRQVAPSNAPPPSAALLQGENPSIERMRRMISEQPGLIGDVMRPQPVMDHGHMNGFRVYPGRDRAAFARLGLRPGDQVTAINGTPLDDRDRSQQILQTLSSSSEARVTVIRGGQTQDLVLNIAQLEQEADQVAAQSQSGVMAPPPGMPQGMPPGGAGVGAPGQQPAPPNENTGP